MEIVFWVMLGLIVLLVIAIEHYSDHTSRETHHDSQPWSHYQISHRDKEK